MLKLMTPGPTRVRENVRLARSLETTNPDVDTDFCEEYKEICNTIANLLYTKNEVFILSGEGILGLEAACASLTEPGDRVLVIDNGIYGGGFADFVSLYGGNPVCYTRDYDKTIDIKELAEYLKEDHDFKYATVVHHDTPSGMMNDVHEIGRLLHQYGILSVVDSVSGMIGEYLNIDEGKLDIVCGGSQKAISAPTGLTFVAISQSAFDAMENRQTPIASFYANLLTFKGYYEKKWFPYTMPASDIYGLRAALDNIKNEPDILKRHESIARAVRAAVIESGLELYGKNGHSNLVTVFKVPDGVGAKDIIRKMKEDHGILLSGSFGVLEDKVIRIGHMGENARVSEVAEALEALNTVLNELGYTTRVNLKDQFVNQLG